MFLRVNFFSLFLVSVLALQVNLGIALSQSRPTDSHQHPSGSSTARAVPPNQDLNRMFARAVALYNAGDLEGAVREYKAILAQVPESVGVRSNLAVALAHLGRYGEAIEQYQRALAGNLSGLNPAMVQEIHFNLAVAYYQSGQFPQAVSELVRLRAAQPQNLRLALLLADCRLRMSEYQKVISLLSPFAAANAENGALDYLLGMSLLRSHRVKEGEVYINHILSQGDSPQARLLLGAAAFEDLKYDDAMKDFQAAIKLDPHLPSAHSFLGLTYMQMGYHDKAIQAFRDEIAQNPNDFESNLYLGALLKDDQNYDESLRYLRRALEIQPNNLAAQYQLGTVYLATGKLAEARAELEGITRAAPNFVEAHVSLAMVYYRLKDKADGDRERAVVRKLNAAAQAEQPAVKAAAGEAYRGPTQTVPQAQ
jgi:tetratricopeptide (TPR) repeat protein